MAKFDLRAYARQGAEARVAELNKELAAIYRAFPDLRSGRAGRTAGARAAESGAAPRRGRKMTAAQRKEVSLRMKRYWANKRKAKS